MKEFIPSHDFVEKTMATIQETVVHGKGHTFAQVPYAFVRIAHYAAAVFGMAFGIMNLARLYLSVFAPIVCR